MSKLEEEYNDRVNAKFESLSVRFIPTLGA